MDSKYFDTLYFKKIADNRKYNPYEANRLFENYIKNYPNDYVAYIYYASNLISIQKFDEAKKVISFIEHKLENDKYFIKYPNKLKLTKKDLLFNKLRLLMLEEKWSEAHSLIINNLKAISELKINGVVLFYCEYKMGLIEIKRNEDNPYIFRQIIQYSEEDFLDHIQKHLSQEEDANIINNNVFIPDFPITNVINEIKKYIPSNKRISHGFFDDSYYFQYNACGRQNGKLVDYIKVPCFKSSDNIITLFPTSKCEHMPLIDLNYLQEQSYSRKRISQIDKFNTKYKGYIK